MSGRELSWLWRTWFYEIWTLDQAIGTVRRQGSALLVELLDRGLAPMPVRLAITRTGGAVEWMEVPVDVWLAGARRHAVRVRGGATVVRVEIDPDNAFPDADRTNQSWVR